jgi:hypothetical protein
VPGSGEPVNPGHVTAIQNNFDSTEMTTLLAGLERETPRRADLVTAARRQLIRAQLYDIMTGKITTLTNIHADGEYLGSTVPRVVSPNTVPDRKLTTGTPRENTVWNASLKDSEVDTIRDIKGWAADFDPRGKADILMDLVGTSGPCEACQARMRNMGSEIMDFWSKKYGVPVSDLPQLRIVSYYGSNPRVPFPRGAYDTYNGWPADQSQPDMEFTNKKNWNQFVQVHPMGVLNAPRRVAPPPTQPTTVTPPTIQTTPPVPPTTRPAVTTKK